MKPGIWQHWVGAEGQDPQEGAAGAGRAALVASSRSARGCNVNSAIFWIREKTVLAAGAIQKLCRQPSQRKMGFFFFFLLSPRSLPQFLLEFLSGKVVLPFKFRTALWCVCAASSSAASLQSTAFQWYSTGKEKPLRMRFFSKELGCPMKAAVACVCTYLLMTEVWLPAEAARMQRGQRF